MYPILDGVQDGDEDPIGRDESGLGVYDIFASKQRRVAT